jgi:hypothetical protein
MTTDDPGLVTPEQVPVDERELVRERKPRGS